MKKTVFVITFLLLFVVIGCKQPVEEEDTPLEQRVERIIHNIPLGDLEILNVEGCEYIVYKDGKGSNHGFGYMAHKGNCTNPIHRYNIPSEVSDSTKKQ